MIISHKYKYIFLKTNKTAGTSIEIALSKNCGPMDVITPISPKDEELRAQLGHPGPQNYIIDGRCDYYNHIPAEDVKASIADDVWRSYFKFCFERNPYDRVVSLYYYRNQREPRISISDFIAHGSLGLLKQKGSDVYRIKNKIVVDKVLRFERINEELESVRKHVGIPDKIELPNAKSGFRQDQRSYRDILCHDDKNIISKMFEAKLHDFGYKW
jgi:hypothetical protein